MKRTSKLFAYIIVFVLAFSLLCACSGSGAAGGGTGGGTNGIVADTGSDVSEVVTVPDSSGMFTDADKTPSYDAASAVAISIDGGAVTADSDTVSALGGKATITEPGTYIVSGSGSNVTIIVDVPSAITEKVRLVLSGASIVNDDFAAIYIKSADKTFIVLEGENSLAVTGSFAAIDYNKVDGVIFAKDNVVLQGEGSLTITSSKHGIVGKDDVKITGGTISVTAANHGIEANDSVRVASASLTIASGKNGIHVENTYDATKGYFYMESGSLKITSGYEGIDASGAVEITGGTTDITSGDGSGKTLSSSDVSTKGVKSSADILISGGNPGGRPGGRMQEANRD